jgi:hypothetical protein
MCVSKASGVLDTRLSGHFVSTYLIKVYNVGFREPIFTRNTSDRMTLKFEPPCNDSNLWLRLDERVLMSSRKLSQGHVQKPIAS